jgi:hypothetical protein
VKASSPESRDFAIALTLAAVLVVCMVAYARWDKPSLRPATAKVPTYHSPDPTDANRPHVIATVYECADGSQRVFSDRPCSRDARVRELSAPNGMVAVQDVARSTSKADPPHAVEPRRDSGDHSSIRAAESLCDSLDQQIDSINVRMRHAYSSAQGEDYRKRLRDLSDRRWDANCRLR